MRQPAAEQRSNKCVCEPWRKAHKRFRAADAAIENTLFSRLAIAKELEEKFSHDESSGLFVAGVYAGLGDRDMAFAWLNKDFQQRSGQLPTVTWRPLFESLRSDRRYTELVRNMGL